MIIESTFNDRRFRVQPKADRTSSAEKTVILHGRFLSPDAFVTYAVGLAYYYGFEIVTPVAFHRKEPLEGCYAFDIKCDANTSRQIYEYGSPKNPRSASTLLLRRRITEYREAFGTAEAMDPEYTERYWFQDSFHGDTHSFSSLAAARKAAAKATGNSICIYTNRRFSTMPVIAERVTGQMPPP